MNRFILACLVVFAIILIIRMIKNSRSHRFQNDEIYKKAIEDRHKDEIDL